MEATQLDDKISYLEQNKVSIDRFFSYKRKHKEIIKNSNNVILQTQQRSRSERHNVFTEEIEKITLSSNDDKRIQSMNSIEKYSYGITKDLVSEKEDTK